MDFKKKYNNALEWARRIKDGRIGFVLSEVEKVFPELQESEDEMIMKALIELVRFAKKSCFEILKDKPFNVVSMDAMIAWLEKLKVFAEHGDGLYYFGNNGFTYVDNPTCDNVSWLEKQGTPAKLSEEEQNRFAKGVLSSCALSFINYLDAHKYEGKMCVSNREFEDIENAFHNAMWDRLHRYYCKYLEKQDEKPQGKTALEAIKEGKVKSKFKVGDWVVFNDKHESVYQIEKIENFQYTLRHILGGSMPLSFSNEDMIRLWTIKDAKDGDVLYSPHCKLIWLYKDKQTCYVGNNLNYHSDSIVVNKPICMPTDARPATKEQRDILFEKMKEEGYEWDDMNKQLKKSDIYDTGR